MHPYEGVWIDVYAVNPEEGDKTTAMPQRSVFYIYLDRDDDKLKIQGRTFENNEMNNSSRYTGTVLSIEEDEKKIYYYYEGVYLGDDPTKIRGFGWYVFNRSLNDDKLNRATGEWIEGDEVGKWGPTGETEVFKVEDKIVRQVLGRKRSYPDTLEDYYALSKLTSGSEVSTQMEPSRVN